MKRHLPVLAAFFVVLGTTAARAEADWFASLYTGEGIELRADERVFTLFALFNAMGYDDAPLVRKDPLPRYQFHPVRAEVRQKLLAADPSVRAAANNFFDAHARPMEHYLQYAVQSAAPPFATGAKAKELQDLKGLEGLLADVYKKWNIGDLMAQVQSEYRKALRPYLTAIDGPMAKARKLLHVPENGPQSLVVLNLLEAENSVHGVMGDGEVVLVVGPSPKPDVEALVAAYAQVFVSDPVSKAARSWAGGPTLLREAQLLGAQEKTVAEYATALFSRAVALKAIDAPDAAYDALAQKGYFGIKEIAQKFEDQRPVDAWALDALQKAETRRPAKK
ncbi:MAG: hypothetical protein IRZ16_23895 [Myxococcaceae bacterium]|nr:hypothetical protein [Myxococcaceae bacterium]